MQDDVKSCLDDCGGALFVGALQRVHRHVVAHDQAVEPDFATHDLVNDDRRRSCRMMWVDGGVDDVRAHCHRQVLELRERREIAFEVVARGVDDGQLVMAVHARPAMTRHVLDDGRDAARE